jgi:hypothetical protein
MCRSTGAERRVRRHDRLPRVRLLAAALGFAGLPRPSMTGPSGSSSPGVTLFDVLYAFCQEHRRCGYLDGGVEGDRFWMTCTCGAAINRNADE